MSNTGLCLDSQSPSGQDRVSGEVKFGTREGGEGREEREQPHAQFPWVPTLCGCPGGRARLHAKVVLAFELGPDCAGQLTQGPGTPPTMIPHSRLRALPLLLPLPGTFFPPHKTNQMFLLKVCFSVAASPFPIRVPQLQGIPSYRGSLHSSLSPHQPGSPCEGHQDPWSRPPTQ